MSGHSNLGTRNGVANGDRRASLGQKLARSSWTQSCRLMETFEVLGVLSFMGALMIASLGAGKEKLSDSG